MAVRGVGVAMMVAAFAAGVAGCSRPEAGPGEAAKPSLSETAAAVARNKIEVRFLPGGATLTDEANQQLDVAARLFREANPVLMFTTGFTDASGDEFGNLVLSAKRAQAVKRALVARGIPADRLLLQAMGSSELKDAAVPASPTDRRVVITWRLL